MLENVVAWVLNTYVGEYLENLNTDQLSVALLSGQVELENVPLKKTALRKLDLPIEVKSGVLGKLTLSVPLTHMRSEPWTLRLSDVLIIVGPISEHKYDVETAEQMEQTKKEQMLDEIEKRHKRQLLEVMGVSATTTEEQESWWGASLIATVVNNIQLILNNVHIRYEDGETLPNGLTFACGVRINKMTVQTTNQQWKPGFVEQQEGVNVFKKLDLTGFALYWNSDQPLSTNIHNVKDLQNLLAPEDAGTNQYIIEPCSLELRMEKNSSKLPLKGNPPIPRFKFWLRPEKIVVELSRRQMTELRALNREWSRFERARLHRKWRPVSGIVGSAKEWWKFACDRIVDDKRRDSSRSSWSHALTRARHLNAYARAYRRRLLMLINNPTTREPADPSKGPQDHVKSVAGGEERMVMKQIERDEQYQFSELNVFRETVFRKLLRDKEKEHGWTAPSGGTTSEVDRDTPPGEGFETIESPSEEVPPALPDLNKPGQNKGLYGWIASFFGGEQPDSKIDGEGASLDFGAVDFHELKNLPPAFKELEKQVEEEILDVLHDSWDDSTVLRKDLLLAEIALKLDHLTLRFIDSKSDVACEQRRVLAIDLMKVTSCVQLSPRTHTLGVSLSVHDLSVQRLVSTHGRHRDTSLRNADELDESLFYSSTENTKVLLAVGRGTKTDEGKPLFKMQYRRCSPRLIVRHTVEGSFRPISIMLDEKAISGLGTLFEDDPEVILATDAVTPLSEMVDVDVCPPVPLPNSTTLETHVFVNLNIPNLSLILRKRGWDESGAPKRDSPAEPFARVKIEDVRLSIVSKELYVSTVTVGVGHMDVDDLLENTNYPLLSTKRRRDLKTVSTSCPDLTIYTSDTSLQSSSLPTPGYLSSLSSTAMTDRNEAASRKTSCAVKGARDKEKHQNEATITCTLVDARHTQFVDRFSKKNCTVELDMNEVEMGMNRRSWTALMEFAGLLGEDEHPSMSRNTSRLRERDTSNSNSASERELRRSEREDYTDVQPSGEPFILACGLHIRTLRINMNYPANGTRLGVVSFQNIDILNSVRLGDVGDQMSLSLCFDGMRVTDRTPLYSTLYDDRMVLTDDTSLVPARAQLTLVKYLGDVDLSREWDLLVQMTVPSAMHMYYVHTHRYFCGLMDFWMQFFELQDQVTKQKKLNAFDGPRSRVKLDIDIQSPTTIVFPLNQLSDQCLVLESSGLRVTNSFKKHSSLSNVFKTNSVDKGFGFDNKIDCLIDCMRAMLSDVQLHEARRIDRVLRREEKGTSSLGRNVFDNFEFHVSKEDIFDKRFDLATDVYRNLDGHLSHNAPDITIIAGVRNLSWRVTTDFYCLLRGFLQCNLADPLVPVPETIPIEILHKPTTSCEVGSSNKYATLSLRIIFEDVSLDCQVPAQVVTSTGVFFDRRYQPFAKMVLTSARVSFDVYIDDQSELDLICDRAELFDTRVPAPGKATNVYCNVLSPRSPNEQAKSPLSLMLEAHILMRKDEVPLVTFVLMGARVIICPDWLNDAKEFLLLNTDFLPPQAADDSHPLLTRTYGTSSTGVVARNVQPSQRLQTMAVKVTLRECDLYFLEDQTAKNSFALVLFTTAVLNMNDATGDLAANLEIQSMHASWCLMDNATSTMSQISNEFKVAIGLALEQKTPKRSHGLPMLTPARHTVQVEVCDLIGKLSYKDARVLKFVVEGWTAHYMITFGNSIIPILPNKMPGKPLEVGKVSVKTEHADLWLLDDVVGGSIPILRFGVSGLAVDRCQDRSTANFAVNIDYFNQRVFGWEPFMEQWRILRLEINQKDKMQVVELRTESKSTLDINLTQDLILQATQWSSRWPAIQQQIYRDDFRKQCSAKSRSDHLPYVLKNETGSELVFTTQVDDVQKARTQQRKATVKWLSVGVEKENTFEFPTRLLSHLHDDREPPRQLLIRVDGWDEISPVNVDACGTYFRVVKGLQSSRENARLVILVSMELDGKKVVTVRSSIHIHNQLPHGIRVHNEEGKELLSVEPSGSAPIPLRYAHSQFLLCPIGPWTIRDMAKVMWKNVRVPGEVLNQTVRMDTEKGNNYWLCTATRREHYPEHESLPGHSIHVVAPLTLLNLLPVDIELQLQGGTYAVGAGKLMPITTVNITKDLPFKITTDHLVTQRECSINKSSIGDGSRLKLRMIDHNGRPLDLYVDAKIGIGGSIFLSFWVQFWVVNKSGIPLVVKQEACDQDSAGQMEEHERAKDKHPLMFSFVDEGCPNACVVRVGNSFVRESGYRAKYSSKFPLTPGVQELKLTLVHDSLPTLYYNIGVEVRPGTCRYKDTQVVLLTSRYLLNNQSTAMLSVCHYDLIDRSHEHVHVAPGCNLVWNENYENTRMLCVRRADVKHWSCPFRIDRIGSFHVTMRDADETPRFVRVEIILNSAVFCVTFTDALYFPPPIQIVNQTEVPVLYQQQSQNVAKQHLRTICKAHSTVDYAWDDPSSIRRLVLQVYENKSNQYDPSMPGTGAPLTYENHMYIQLKHSFKSENRSKKTEECELVLESMQKGKVTLNKQNRLDGNGGNQLWRMTRDGCIENVGMNARTKRDERMVLDVLEKAGNKLMLCERSEKRDKYQKWFFLSNGRLVCGLPGVYVTASRTEVCMSGEDQRAEVDEDGVDINQVWKCQRQRPGSGILDVECLHNGPTLVVRITDREDNQRQHSHIRTGSMPVLSERPSLSQLTKQQPGIEFSITMNSGFGMSVVNSLHEELVYARLGRIVAHARKTVNTYQLTASVDVIQVDNQMLCADKWQVIYCDPHIDADDEMSIPAAQLPPGVPATVRPALKLEMNCTPMKHYDAFDCFRLKLCDMSVQLDELLLWKLVHFAQESNASKRVQPSAMTQPPNTELERPDPLAARRCYFGTLDLEMGQISLSVLTVAKQGLPRELRALKQQFNVKLLSFENATVTLLPFRQFHYFETSSFLLESLKKYYASELRKQTLSIIVTMDAFGNPLGLVTDLKDSFQGLVIEHDVSRFVAGVGYGFSNSISKMASSIATGVGALTYDEEHELKRRHNMLRSQSTTSSTPLAHFYSGIKGLGVGVFGGLTAVVQNTITETKRSGYVTGAVRGLYTGTIDTVTKPVQGIFDLVEGTASAMKEIAGPATGVRRPHADKRIRAPRLCVNLFHLLPSYSEHMANAQLEMLRINGYSQKESLLDVELCLEQLSMEEVVRQYVLISTKQCYVCRQVNDDASTVLQRIPYKFLRTLQPRPELTNAFASVEVILDSDDKRQKTLHIWCSRAEVAKRLGDKMLRAKSEYDHNKRTLKEQKMVDELL